MGRRAMFVLALSWWGGCRLDLPEGRYACELDGSKGCPPGWVCSLRPEDGEPRCYRQPQETCGNGLREGSEECDGSDLAGATCHSIGAGSQGTLRCRPDCRFDASQCHTCGNGLREGSEECDGSDLGDLGCFELTGRSSGALACSPDCTIDTSGCHECGDGVAEGPEECDSTDLRGLSCEDLGMSGGRLRCGRGCRLDPSRCYACGDGRCDVDLGEDRVTCPGDCGWIAVACGGYHTCGLLADGSVWCWGSNAKGQLGDGTFESSPVPVRVALPAARSVWVSAGAEHSCAVSESGEVWCWGDGTRGALGPATFSESATPVQVGGVANAASVACGEGFTCARTTDGEASCWGSNDLGQLGRGQAGADATEPLPVSLPAPAEWVSAGAGHACAVLADGGLWCWGDSSAGQLGPGGSGVVTPSPVQVPLEATALSVASGSLHTCGLLWDGSVWCWGDNTSGALGTGTLDSTSVPEAVRLVGAASWVGAGLATSCAVWGLGGSVWCWGSNLGGRLGVGLSEADLTESPTPLAVTLESAVSLDVGRGHVCAVESNGIMVCWGRNSDGQLGTGDTLDASVPREVVSTHFWHFSESIQEDVAW